MIPAKEKVNIYRGSTNNLFFTFSNSNGSAYNLTHFVKSEIAVYESGKREKPHAVNDATIDGNSISISYTPEQSLEVFRYNRPKIEVRFYTDSVNFFVYFIGEVNILTPHDVVAEIESNDLIVEGDTIVNVGVTNDSNLIASAITARNEIISINTEVTTIKGEVETLKIQAQTASTSASTSATQAEASNQSALLAQTTVEQLKQDTIDTANNASISIENARITALSNIDVEETASINAVNTARDNGIASINTVKDQNITAIDNARINSITDINAVKDQGIIDINNARDTSITTINGLITQAETARDGAVTAKNQSETARDTAQTQAGIAMTKANEAGIDATDANNHAQSIAPFTGSDGIGYDKGAKGWNADTQVLKNEVDTKHNEITGAISIIDEGNDWYELQSFAPSDLVDGSEIILGTTINTVDIVQN